MKHWVATLQMWKKFALIGALAIGMVAAPTALMVSEHWSLMDAARAEAAGMAPAGDVLKLIQLTLDLFEPSTPAPPRTCRCSSPARGTSGCSTTSTASAPPAGR